MSDDLLAQGIKAVKAGNVQQARQLLYSAIRQNPNDEHSWEWFYKVAANDEERLRCLREVLRIDPDNESAKQRYDEMLGLGFQSPFTAPTTKKGNMPKYQRLILGSMVFILALIVVIFGVIIWPDISNSIFPPTQTPTLLPTSNRWTTTSIPSPTFDASPTFVISLTERPTPTTRIKLPTWTPLATIKPMPSLTRGPSNNSSGQVPGGTDCSAQYAYIDSLHQYYLDYINSSYDNTLAYYQSLLQSALERRDGLEMARIDEDIARVKAERDSHINIENSRYQADRAYLNAKCK